MGLSLARAVHESVRKIRWLVRVVASGVCGSIVALVSGLCAKPCGGQSCSNRRALSCVAAK